MLLNYETVCWWQPVAVITTLTTFCKHPYVLSGILKSINRKCLEGTRSAHRIGSARLGDEGVPYIPNKAFLWVYRSI
jgi:hypothetical protein